MIMPDRGELAVSDRNGARRRIGAVECRKQTAMKDQVGRGGWSCHDRISAFFYAIVVSGVWSPGSDPGKCCEQSDCRHAALNAGRPPGCGPLRQGHRRRARAGMVSWLMRRARLGGMLA